MKRTTKYVALDVHQATTVVSVREANRRVVARAIIPTEAGAISEFFAGMRGSVHVAFEEGTQAQWLHDLLSRSSVVSRSTTRESRNILTAGFLVFQRWKGPLV